MELLAGNRSTLYRKYPTFARRTIFPFFKHNVCKFWPFLWSCGCLFLRYTLLIGFNFKTIWTICAFMVLNHQHWPYAKQSKEQYLSEFHWQKKEIHLYKNKHHDEMTKCGHFLFLSRSIRLKQNKENSWLFSNKIQTTVGWLIFNVVFDKHFIHFFSVSVF